MMQTQLAESPPAAPPAATHLLCLACHDMVGLRGEHVRCRCERSMASCRDDGFAYVGPACAATYVWDPATPAAAKVARLADGPSARRLAQDPLL